MQVDCKDNIKVIEVSTQMSRHLNIIQIAKSSDNLDVRQSLLLQIQSINVSLFETSGDFMIRDPQTKDQKKRQLVKVSNCPVELFQLRLSNISLQRLQFEKTEAFEVGVSHIILKNMQPQADNATVFEIDPESISFQAERLRDSSFYTHIGISLNKLTVQIDQNFYESGFRYFS